MLFLHITLKMVFRKFGYTFSFLHLKIKTGRIGDMSITDWNFKTVNIGSKYWKQIFIKKKISISEKTYWFVYCTITWSSPMTWYIFSNLQILYLINAYPLSLKILISWMQPKCENVFCRSSSVRPFVIPPQYTVQFVGLDWL